jgi:serine/threonine protein kinase
MPTDRIDNDSTQPDHSSGAASAPTPAGPLSNPSAPTLASSSGLASEPGSDTVAEGMVGATLAGRYFIDRALGQGGMGQVYLAKDLQLHSRPVVVKLLLEEAYKDQYLLKKFRQEMEALSRIRHPGVIGIIDAGELSDAKPFIVMEYVEGVNLRSAIRPEGMSLARVADLMKQLGRALSAAHDKGIFHRDLKPENIMVQDLGQGEELVKIIDFGIAKIKQSVVAPTTAAMATAGTIAYMAPEQLSAKPVYLTSDVYSLGIIAYEMVTGRRPFNPETPFELLEMQRSGVRVKPVDLRPSLSLKAQQSILKALSFEPQQRYQSARDFGDELASALLNEGETLGLQGHGSNDLTVSLGQGAFDPRLPSAGETIRTPSGPQWPATFDQSGGTPQPPSSKTPRLGFSLNTPWLKVAVGFFSFLIIASALFGVVYKVGTEKSAGPNTGAAPVSKNISTAAERSLTYWLTVQKMRDGKAYQEPFESSGQEIFEGGYKFQLNISSPQSGYLYLLNEGPSDDGTMSFTMIYPTPLRNNGSAKLEGSQAVQTAWNQFLGKAGTEQFWIVWSATPVSEMEAAKDAAFKDKEGGLTDGALIRAVREFLRIHSEPKPETKKDTVKQQTSVRGTGDLLVKLVELEHR